MDSGKMYFQKGTHKMSDLLVKCKKIFIRNSVCVSIGKELPICHPESEPYTSEIYFQKSYNGKEKHNSVKIFLFNNYPLFPSAIGQIYYM